MATVKSYEIGGGKRYRVRYRKPDGSQTDKRGFRTKRDADLFAATVEVKKASGEYIDPSRGNVTIGELGEKWLASRAHLKPSSKAAYESAWRLHVKPRWEDVRVGHVEHSEVQAWLSRLGAGDKEVKIKPKSATTVRRAHDILAGILDVAVKDQRIPANRARGVTLPRKVAREHLYLTHAQVEALVKASGDHGPLVALIAYTGLRWGEASALRVQDLNLLRRRLTVAQNAVLVNGRVIVGTPKTHETRTVPFPAFLTFPLAAACEGKGPSALVFPGQGGGYMVTPTIRENSWWDKALVSAGLPPLRIHDLRHTAASLAVSAGANVKAIQRMLGHSSASMTLDVYSELFDDDLDSVAISLDAAAKSSVGKMWANTHSEPGSAEGR